MSKAPHKNAIHRVSFCHTTIHPWVSKLVTGLVSVSRIMSRLTAYRNAMNRIMSRLTACRNAINRIMSSLTACRNAMNRIMSRLTAYRNAINRIMSSLTACRNAINRVFTGGIPGGSAMSPICAVLMVMLVLAACSTPNVVKVWSDEKHEIDTKKVHQTIYFVQGKNQINSRVAMDELVRLSPNKSIQGYLYTKGDPINLGNREYYKNKMKQDGYDYVVLMSLADSVTVATTVEGGNPSSDKSFYGDYSFTIDPYAYNPSYERENKVFSILTNVYFVETGNKVWVCESKVYNPSSVEQAIRETSKEVVKKMKRTGFMN